MGMMIVADQGRIVYAALQGEVAKELRRAIAMPQADPKASEQPVSACRSSS